MQKFLLENTSYFIGTGETHPFSSDTVFKKLGEKKFVLALLNSGLVTPEKILSFRPMLEWQKRKVCHCVMKFLIKNGRFDDACDIAEEKMMQERISEKGQYWNFKYLGCAANGWFDSLSFVSGKQWTYPLKDVNLSYEVGFRVFLKRGGEIPERDWPLYWDKFPYFEKFLVKTKRISEPPPGCVARAYSTAQKYGNKKYAELFEKDSGKIFSSKEEKYKVFAAHSQKLGFIPEFHPVFSPLLCEIIKNEDFSWSLAKSILFHGRTLFKVMESDASESFRRKIRTVLVDIGPELRGESLEHALFFKFVDVKKFLLGLSMMDVKKYYEMGIISLEEVEKTLGS